MKYKKYNQAPLPFQGQKRKFLKEFQKALQEYPSNGIYVDLFGGSGLLSHTTKCLYPNATVIYNDFDNYTQRLEAIGQTNVLLAKIRFITKDLPKDKRITGNARDSIITILEEANNQDFVDWITLSSSLLFSGKYAISFDQIRKETLYNVVKQNDYNADGYLEGVEVVREDYRVLYNQYKHNDNVVFIIDPPYLATDSSTYKSNAYWKLTDYLDVLNTLNKSYFYFTSNKSHLVELCEWIESKTPMSNPFHNATRVEIATSVNHTAKYTDIMYHLKRENTAI